jgi:hypothetical protein
VRKATLVSVLAKAAPGLRLNDHLEHENGATIFRHACKMGLEGIVSKRGFGLSLGTLARLAQDEEPGLRGGAARGGRGLGQINSVSTMEETLENFDELCKLYSEARRRNRDYAVKAAQFVRAFAAELGRQIGAPASFRLPSVEKSPGQGRH